MGIIIEDLERVFQMSVFSSKDMPDLNIQHLILESFLGEVDTDLYLDTVRMEYDQDDNYLHHHDHDHDHDGNHRYNRERNDMNGQLDLGGSRKRRRVISSEGSGNGQNIDD
ncbi:MAG: hypothetical protein EZS28_049791 [Streblomastix strix]|uniref:Uncharacterized protein n=1 Tax=Streblomastix strix TaxID=222440 RepID=A0A5J4T9S5_9EUKA|nr:MAG: hypothetical protein EZS28_049791 [Streblomastix strix]